MKFLMALVMMLVGVGAFADQSVSAIATPSIAEVQKILRKEFKIVTPTAKCRTRFVEIYPETNVDMDIWWNFFRNKPNTVGWPDAWGQRLRYYAIHGDKLAGRKLMFQLMTDGVYAEEGDEHASYFLAEAPCEYLLAYQSFSPEVRKKFSNLETANWDVVEKGIAKLKKMPCPGMNETVKNELLKSLQEGVAGGKGASQGK